MDMSAHVAPKSDQMNADDLIAGPRTITITKVSGTGNADQPVAVSFVGDEGKPYKPCKGMRRVMINSWGADAAVYAGRRMTLYRDETVAFGGMAVGGIRISHVSDIAKPVTMALTATRAQRKPFTVKPLPAEQVQKPEAEQQQAPKRTLADVAREKARAGQVAYDEWVARLKPAQVEQLTDLKDDIDRLLDEADERQRDAAPADDFPGNDAIDADHAREDA